MPEVDHGRLGQTQESPGCQTESSMAGAGEEKSEISFEGSTSMVRKKIMNMIQVYLVQLSNWIAVKYPFLELQRD